MILTNHLTNFTIPTTIAAAPNMAGITWSIFICLERNPCHDTSTNNQKPEQQPHENL